MKYLLDTNVCIGWLRQNQPVLVARIKQKLEADLLLCSVVVGELQFGIERSDPAHRAKTAMQVEEHRQKFASVPYDDAAAEEYGRIRGFLASQGTPIGGNDIQIAAIARVNGFTLVTHNVSDFSRVPGLLIEDWQVV